MSLNFQEWLISRSQESSSLLCSFSFVFYFNQIIFTTVVCTKELNLLHSIAPRAKKAIKQTFKIVMLYRLSTMFR